MNSALEKINTKLDSFSNKMERILKSPPARTYEEVEQRRDDIVGLLADLDSIETLYLGAYWKDALPEQYANIISKIDQSRTGLKNILQQIETFLADHP